MINSQQPFKFDEAQKRWKDLINNIVPSSPPDWVYNDFDDLLNKISEPESYKFKDIISDVKKTKQTVKLNKIESFYCEKEFTNNNEIIFKLIIPGVDPDSIDVFGKKDLLTVKYTQNNEKIEKVLLLFVDTNFVFISQLNVEVKYKDGLLEIKIPLEKEDYPTIYFDVDIDNNN